MGRAAGRDAAGGQHRAGHGLPRRPEEGAADAQAHLEYQGTHRAPGRDAPGRVTDLGLLQRIRDALASGRQP
jgi:hypothetical protein